MKQKHFIDISHAVFESTEFFEKNVQGFEPGDEIVIQTKVDGANTCVAYNAETNELACFSSKKELGYNETLRGFWNYVQLLSSREFQQHPTWRVFGEWLCSHTIIYDKESYNKWYVYDIFDTETMCWLPQRYVEEFCNNAALMYVHTYYHGEFRSWDHVKSFLDKPVYGNQLEGVVIKNQTKMQDSSNHLPSYLKIVNPRFKEIQLENHKQKVEDPQKLQAREKAQAIAEAVITKARVEKQLRKMVDEGVLPEKFSPQDMGFVAKSLPKRIYDDCIKEHGDLVAEAGEYFGKMCSSRAMLIAKEIIFGS